MNNKPLAEIRITDIGWILSVPHATAWLGTFGADVIRVESGVRMDLMRVGAQGAADGIPGLNRAGGFNSLNVSKKSVTLNLADPRGADIAKELVRHSDVVTENFATGVMEGFDLGYETLREIKPDIIMLSGTPLGNSGPQRLASGWGPNTQAYAGLPHITGYEGRPPSGLGGVYPDYMIGVAMTFAVLAALHHHARTGEGQHVDMAMAETVTGMIPEAVIEYTMNGRERPRMGNRSHPTRLRASTVAPATMSGWRSPSSTTIAGARCGGRSGTPPGPTMSASPTSPDACSTTTCWTRTSRSGPGSGRTTR